MFYWNCCRVKWLRLVLVLVLLIKAVKGAELKLNCTDIVR